MKFKFLCKICNHPKENHGVYMSANYDCYPSKCLIRYNRSMICLCYEFKYKNLDYLEQKYEESIK